MTERYPILTPDTAPPHFEEPRSPDGSFAVPEVVDPEQLIMDAGRQTAATLQQTEVTHTPWSRDPDFQNEDWAFDGPSDEKTTDNAVANRLAAHGWSEHPAVSEYKASAAATRPSPEASAVVSEQPKESRGRFWRRRQPASVPGDEHNDFWGPIK